MSLQNQLEFEFKKISDDVIIHTTLGELRELVQDTKRDITVWAENWFDDKRRDNTIWRINQDEIGDLFLEDMEIFIQIGEKKSKTTKTKK